MFAQPLIPAGKEYLYYVLAVLHMKNKYTPDTIYPVFWCFKFANISKFGFTITCVSKCPTPMIYFIELP